MVKILVWVWAISLAISCFGVGMALALSMFTGDVRYFSLTLNGFFMLVNMTMLRFQVRKLRKERERVKREDFIQMMFNEWLR